MIPALALALLSASGASAGAPGMSVWDCPEPVPITGDGGVEAGWRMEGCGWAGSSGDILLPCKYLYIPVDLSGDPPSVVIEPLGVTSLGRAAVSRVIPDPDGGTLVPARAGDVPSDWGGLVSVETWRRVPVARIVLNPVISRGGELLVADRMVLRLEGGAEGGRGGTDALVGALTGMDGIRTGPAARRAGSPFWGLPWARILVDTAGVFALDCTDLPWAGGTPSASLSMYCGRGRMMGSEPWLDTYEPRPVPIAVSDGGDGTFDPGDSIFFFARGLSWWEPGGEDLPEHFMHLYDDRNCYWLTWGGADGARMPVIDAGSTGAPSAGSSFLARIHFEQDYERLETGGSPWVWDASYGSGSQWFYHSFDCPGASGEGILRLHLYSPAPGRHSILITLDGVTLADTGWTGLEPVDIDVACTGLAPQGNMLGYRIEHSPAMDDVFFDWFEVAYWRPFSGAVQTHVPLDWLHGPARFSVAWQGAGAGTRVFAVSGDTLAAELAIDTPQLFEVEIPGSWPSDEVWMVPGGGFASPAAVEEAAPGIIMGTMEGADRIYLSAPDFLDDIAPLAGGPGEVLLCADEVYDELNGGVRDPGAIRALVDLAVKTWDPIPSDLVLVGTGHWDPLNRLSSTPSFIDVLYFESSTTSGDDAFTIVEGSAMPQMAVSRIAARQRTDVELLVQKTLVYESGASAGAWQTLFLGAADDERSSKHPSDETMHTESMERLIEQHLPAFVRPVKHYLIFYDFDEMLKKPEARADFIDLWSGGALMVVYLGHGAFDQLADEGLMYLEDTGLLACGDRLPIGFFGSCRVGEFQDPGKDCIAQNITTSPAGGAILGIGATGDTGAPLNEELAAEFMDEVFSAGGSSAGAGLLIAKLQAGYSDNNRMYVMFGDGSISPAVPPDDVTLFASELRKGEQAQCGGSAPVDGLVLIEAFESCHADTYYTFRQSLPIAYMAEGGRFYAGSAAATPGFEFQMFVPVDARTGSSARIDAFLPSGPGSPAGALYPVALLPGSPSPSDTTGPEIELWVVGFRHGSHPSVSGEVSVAARLSDPSGINLLGNPGRQLALYVDGSPQDVSGAFRYDPGSSTDGSLEVLLGTLSEGEHVLEMRASDCLLNRSSTTAGFTVVAAGGLLLSDVFVYPCPASDGTSFNWTQSGEGSVEIAVYTVTGRLVAQWRNITAGEGYNQLWWDCTDADGDPLASGAYVYRIRASSGNGSDDIARVFAIVR